MSLNKNLVENFYERQIVFANFICCFVWILKKKTSAYNIFVLPQIFIKKNITIMSTKWHGLLGVHILGFWKIFFSSKRLSVCCMWLLYFTNHEMSKRILFFSPTPCFRNHMLSLTPKLDAGASAAGPLLCALGYYQTVVEN